MRIRMPFLLKNFGFKVAPQYKLLPSSIQTTYIDYQHLPTHKRAKSIVECLMIHSTIKNQILAK